MEKPEIILIGGGGHCLSCIEVIESMSEFQIAGIIDSKSKIGDEILGYKIIGCDDDLRILRNKYDYALISIGQMESVTIRKKLFNLLKELGYILPVIMASTAYVSRNSVIGEGSIVMHQSIVNSLSRIGKNCIINTRALIEHGTIVGDFCHISTNAVLNGNVSVGDECFIGSNTTFANGLSVVSDVFIGANSLITKNIKFPGVYIGSPAKKQIE